MRLAWPLIFLFILFVVVASSSSADDEDGVASVPISRQIKNSLRAGSSKLKKAKKSLPKCLRAPLRVLGKARGLRIGSAVNLGGLTKDSRYRDVLKREFAIGTLENEMKWSFIHPERDVYDFSKAKPAVDFMHQNSIALRGHTLVWHRQNPDWLVNGGFSVQELKEILVSHIQTVVGNYSGRAVHWDVVNEALNDDGTPRKSVWSPIGFPAYLDLAFRTARKVDPKAKLFYNDYNIEYEGKKFKALKALVAGMKKRGVPIDGVGFQTHMTTKGSSTSLKAALRSHMLDLRKLGLEAAITEMDVALVLPTSSAKLSLQSRFYIDVLEACLTSPNCHTFMTWGFTDKYSWVPEYRPGSGAALVYDTSYRAKPAYKGIVKILQGACQ